MIEEENRLNIIVCIKQVPDTNEVKLNPETGTLIRDGVPSIINPDIRQGWRPHCGLKTCMEQM